MADILFLTNDPHVYIEAPTLEDAEEVAWRYDLEVIGERVEVHYAEGTC